MVAWVLDMEAAINTLRAVLVEAVAEWAHPVMVQIMVVEVATQDMSLVAATGVLVVVKVAAEEAVQIQEISILAGEATVQEVLMMIIVLEEVVAVV